ncbi:MAG: ATPase, T2SS/T4P/T4SS family, partial [Arcobacter sp.]
MKSILKNLIDYSLFERYDTEYFIKNKIVPLFEDNIYLKVAVCKSSNLNSIKNDFVKLISYEEVDELELLFILSNLDRKISLFTLCTKSIFQNSFEKYVNQFLDELLLFSIEVRASDIHIEKYKELVVFKFRVDGKLKTFFTFKEEFFRLISSYIKLISNLDMTMTRLPLDGRFSLTIENKKYDFRVSTMPTLEAESIVLRI